nr:hypothetical protein [Candidatus Freyrarchaeum guaymaensis]
MSFMIDYENVAYVVGVLGAVLAIAGAIESIVTPLIIASILSYMPFASIGAFFIYALAPFTALESLIPIVLGAISLLGCRYVGQGEVKRAAAVFLATGATLTALSILEIWLPVAGSITGGIALIAAGIVSYRI